MISVAGHFKAFYDSAKNRAPIGMQVVAWSDEGHALVLDSERGKLVRADQRKGFRSVHQEGPTYAGMVPGGGWMYEFTSDDGSTRVQPVVAWMLKHNGDFIPCNLSDDDSIYASEVVGDGIRIYHPEATGRNGPGAPNQSDAS